APGRASGSRSRSSRSRTSRMPCPTLESSHPPSSDSCPMADPIKETWTASPEGLRDLVEHLRASGRFAFDTEFVSEETFEPVLGLVQVATRDRLAVIDPLAVRDLGPF